MKYLLCVIFPFICCALYAQQHDDDTWEQYLTTLYGNNEEAAVAMEEAYEHLTELAQQPLDINKVETQDLMQIPGLDLNQINDILTYRLKYGNFRSVDELAMIQSIDNNLRRYLSHFLAVDSKDNQKWYTCEGLKAQLHQTRNEVTLTASVPTYYRAGDINAPTATSLGQNNYAGKYLGDPVKHSLRYSLDIGTNISFKLTGAKSAGEPFFGEHNRWGYDRYAYNISIRQLGICRQIIVGTFRGQFGMGLILNNNFYMGKQGMLSSMGRRASVFTPHSSASDSKHFQGIAATMDLTKCLQLSAFFSYRFIDATLNADSSVSTILSSAYHRTATEMEKKNNTSQFTTGMHLGYERKSWGIGVSGIFSHLGRDINPVYSSTGEIPASKLYRLYNATGNDFWNISMDYRYRWRDLAFSGETATGGSGQGSSPSMTGKTGEGLGGGGLATINTLTWRSPWGITFMALQRYYAYQYVSLFGRSFGENSSLQNESGFYFGLQWQARRNITIDAYTDIAYSPWMKYLVSNSSYCWDSSLIGTLTTGKWTWSLRYRVKMKQRNSSEDSSQKVVKELVNRTDHRLRLLAQLTNTRWTSRTQLEGCLLNFDSTSKGFVVSEALGYKISINPKPSSLNLTVAYFNTDSYDSRIYTWEPSMKYSFGNTSYYGKGMHVSIIAKYRPLRWLTAAAKVSHTRYFDRDEIGTAERMIFSNNFTDLDFQLICKL